MKTCDALREGVRDMPSSSAYLYWQHVFSVEADLLAARRAALPTTSSTGVVRGLLGQYLDRGLDSVSTRLSTAVWRSRDLASECARRATVCLQYRDAVAAAHAAHAVATAGWSATVGLAALDPMNPAPPGPPPLLVLPAQPAPWADPA
jgi:hypothetical protein